MMVYVHVYGFMALAMLGLAIMTAPRKMAYWSSNGALPAFAAYLAFVSIFWPVWVAVCTLDVMNDVRELD